MTTLIISPEARADLEEIGDYIAQDNVEAAISFIERLETCCMNIARSPGIGRKRDHLQPGLRSCAEGSYLIFYRLTGSIMEIVRILHGRRDIESLFE